MNNKLIRKNIFDDGSFTPKLDTASLEDVINTESSFSGDEKIELPYESKYIGLIHPFTGGYANLNTQDYENLKEGNREYRTPSHISRDIKNEENLKEVDKGHKFIHDWYSNSKRQAIKAQNDLETLLIQRDSYLNRKNFYDSKVSSSIEDGNKNDIKYYKKKRNKDEKRIDSLNKEIIKFISNPEGIAEKTSKELKNSIQEVINLPISIYDSNSGKNTLYYNSNEVFPDFNYIESTDKNKYTPRIIEETLDDGRKVRYRQTTRAYYSPNNNKRKRFLSFDKNKAFNPGKTSSVGEEDQHAMELESSELLAKNIVNGIKKYNPDFTFDEYYDSGKEILGKLGNLRKELNIDPNKEYSLKEIKEMKKNYTGDNHIMKKYPPEILMLLFNRIAENDVNHMNNTMNDVYYVKNGKKLIPKCQTAWTPLVKQQEFPQHLTVPEIDHGTITQGKKVNPIIRGINNYFGELKYAINNGEIPTGKYTIPATIIAAYSLPVIGKAIITNPLSTAKTFGKSILGGVGVDAALNATTGKDWGENIHDLTGLDKDVADYTNAGYFLGPSIFNAGKRVLTGGKNVIKNLIHKPKAWEVLPDGTEIVVPIDKAPIAEVVTESTGRKGFTPDLKSLTAFGERVRPQTLLQYRLESGGYDKLGIGENTSIIIPENHRFAQLSTLNPNNFVNGFVKVDGKKFINRTFSQKPNDTKYKSNYDPHNQDIYVDPNAWEDIVEPEVMEIIKNNPDLLENFKNMTKTHELFHLTQLAKKIQAHPKDKAAWKNAIKQLREDTIEFPGVDYNKLPEYVSQYFKSASGTEMMARFSQLRDYYGIYDSSVPLTLEQWNHAKKHYPYNNNMEEFFDCITDPKTFIDYMNKIVPVFTALGLLNNNTNEE